MTARAERQKQLDERRRYDLRFANSYTRMSALLALARAADFWSLVRDEWSGCDNIANHYCKLLAILGRERARNGFPIRAAMDDDALAAYAGLPEVVTVYRGCYTGNVYGLSWTLNRQMAARFPFLNRYRQHDAEKRALVIEGRVRRGDIAFLVTERQEEEVVVLPWNVTIRTYQLAVEIDAELVAAISSPEAH